MKNKDHIQDELNELSPLLAELRQEEEGYKVPHLYFESLQNKVLNQVQEASQKVGFFMRFGWVRGSVMVASVAVLLLAGVFLFQNNNTETADIENISTDVLAMYLDGNVEDWDLDLLIEDDFELDFTNGLNLDADEWDDYIEEELLDSDNER